MRSFNINTDNICHTYRDFGHVSCQYPFKKTPSKRTSNLDIQTPSKPIQNWVMDSGANHHLMPDLKNLTVNSEYTGPKEVTIDNGNTF